MAKEGQGRLSLPTRIGIRKVNANVPKARRAQKRVGRRVEEDIGIGVTFQARYFESNASEHHRSVSIVGEGVNVVTQTCSRLHKADDSSCLGQIVGSRDLKILRIAWRQLDRKSC